VHTAEAPRQVERLKDALKAERLLEVESLQEAPLREESLEEVLKEGPQHTP
jgi:hypothetical protein